MQISRYTMMALSVAVLYTSGSLMASAQIDAPADDVKQAMDAYNVRYNNIVQSYDIDAFIALYNDQPLWIAPNEPPVEGLEVPRNTLQFLADKAGVLSHTVQHVYASDDGSQAVLIGQYDAAIDSIDKQSTGTYLFVMERGDDDWDIVVDMFNEHTAP